MRVCLCGFIIHHRVGFALAPLVTMWCRIRIWDVQRLPQPTTHSPRWARACAAGSACGWRGQVRHMALTGRRFPGVSRSGCRLSCLQHVQRGRAFAAAVHCPCPCLRGHPFGVGARARSSRMLSFRHAAGLGFFRLSLFHLRCSRFSWPV